MKQIIAMCILLVLINPAFTIQCGDEMPDDVEYDCNDSEADDALLKNNTFYATIKETMTSKNYSNYDRYLKFPERVDCIIDDLKTKNAISTLDDSTYEFVQSEEDEKFEITFKNITITMQYLERMIQDASFDCQGMNTFRIMFIIFLVVITIVCLGLCIRVRLIKRVKWSSVEQQ
ncbi:hypothetical protein PVAND_004331 [Polypedilum vanderplanki]|uniref:Uncharacterized protein n=1 Tax=Polypedilum vanderplanki TaxID=319348 RepID=A0A9J6BWT8_POLVA|nr:hypothetical protein PVAND_004331 [Polypedilum vanderplanki]